MILPIVLANKLEGHIKEHADKFCLDCLDKVPKTASDCDHCKTSNIGLFLRGHNAYRTSDFYRDILGDIARIIRPVSKGGERLDEVMDLSVEFFVFGKYIYRTEDAINAIDNTDYRIAG